MPEEPAFIPEHEFDAVLELDSEVGGGVYLLVPFSVEAHYGQRGHLPVRVTLDGFPYQGSLFPLGDGTHGLPVLKAIRGAIGKTWGHTVRVRLLHDVAPRRLTPPDDLADALALVPGARERFANLAYTHQREYVRWVESAKKDDTRRKRVTEAAAMIGAGKKRG